MNVLYLHQHFSTRTGNGGTRSWEFAKYLMRHGDNVSMIAQRRRGGGVYEPGRHDLEGMELVLLGGFYTNHLPAWKRVWQFIRVTVQASLLFRFRHKPDVVVASSTPLTIGIPGWILARRYGVPFVFEVRDLWPEAPIQLGAVRNKPAQKLLYWFERWLYKRADVIIPLSPGMEDGVLANGGAANKIVMIPNASDVDLYTPEARDRSLLTERWPQLEGKFVVIHGGSMGKANGLDYVVAAAEQLRDRGETDIAFVLAGNGGTKKRLRAYCQDNGLDNVIFAGSIPREELGPIGSSCDVAMVCFADYPVLATNSPNKFFDGLAAGLPCIVNSDGWTRAQVELNDVGRYVDPKQPEQLADALVQLRDDEELRTRQGANARQLALNVFARERLAERFRDVLCWTVDHDGDPLPPELRASLLPQAAEREAVQA
jgi:glycosyltransferase involved in cell wall biosynthesis